MSQTKIIEALSKLAPRDAVVKKCAVGIFWTFVETQYGCAISASAHRWIEDPPGAIIPCAGSVVGMRVSEVAELYNSPSLTARSLANAAIAASFSASRMTGIRMAERGQDLLSSLCKKAPCPPHIALIGHFHFADELKEMGCKLDIYELDGRCELGDIPSSHIPELLPQADIVVMTSSTLITHATEQILDCCRKDAFKMIVGPTVPVHPILWDYGFDAVCASVIHDPDQVRRVAAQGGNHRQMTGAEKINFLRPT